MNELVEEKKIIIILKGKLGIELKEFVAINFGLLHYKILTAK